MTFIADLIHLSVLLRSTATSELKRKVQNLG